MGGSGAVTGGCRDPISALFIFIFETTKKVNDVRARHHEQTNYYAQPRNPQELSLEFHESTMRPHSTSDREPPRHSHLVPTPSLKSFGFAGGR